jgi:hypothetical protein
MRRQKRLGHGTHAGDEWSLAAGHGKVVVHSADGQAASFRVLATGTMAGRVQP